MHRFFKSSARALLWPAAAAACLPLHQRDWSHYQDYFLVSRECSMLERERFSAERKWDRAFQGDLPAPRAHPAVFESLWEQQCWICHDEKATFRCYKCGVPGYCSHECSERDVPNHSICCGAVKLRRPVFIYSQNEGRKDVSLVVCTGLFLVLNKDVHPNDVYVVHPEGVAERLFTLNIPLHRSHMQLLLERGWTAEPTENDTFLANDDKYIERVVMYLRYSGRPLHYNPTLGVSVPQVLAKHADRWIAK